LVRATGMAPTQRIRATTTASAGATLSRKAAAPAVVGPPSTSRFSLTVNGTPCRGPSECPAAIAWPAAAAAATASGCQCHGDGVDRRVHRIDPGQVCADDLSAADLFGRYSLRQVECAQRPHFLCHRTRFGSCLRVTAGQPVMILWPGPSTPADPAGAKPLPAQNIMPPLRGPADSPATLRVSGSHRARHPTASSASSRRNRWPPGPTARPPWPR
jgi:hypothetical protein